jgi:hypothetical protein
MRIPVSLPHRDPRLTGPGSFRRAISSIRQITRSHSTRSASTWTGPSPSPDIIRRQSCPVGSAVYRTGSSIAVRAQLSTSPLARGMPGLFTTCEAAGTATSSESFMVPAPHRTRRPTAGPAASDSMEPGLRRLGGSLRLLVSRSRAGSSQPYPAAMRSPAKCAVRGLLHDQCSNGVEHALLHDAVNVRRSFHERLRALRTFA